MAENPEPTAEESGRNLVICLDGTTNEPETGFTNVARIFDVAQKNDRQLVYYDPGVGTMGARAAVTRLGRAATRAAGMVAGYGIRENIEEAYTWLAHRYQPGDDIYVFGFSRGAYTARALTGMLRTVGLLHADADNLVPYALKLYAKSGPAADPGREPDENAKKAEKDFWKLRDDFRKQFGNPDFPNPFRGRKQVRFLGVWDTVKFVGWLNLKARIEVARWPFTANIANVETARHALAIDERRRPFAEYRIKPETVAGAGSAFQEVWFAGVHGDVGGQCRDNDRLPDITFSWMVKEADRAGFRVDKAKYRRLLKVTFDDALPPELALGVIQPNAKVWRLALGWRTRTIRPDDALHPSVRYRLAAMGDEYRPKNLRRYWPETRPSSVTQQMTQDAQDQPG
jgi:uncharacterized protein (DUF2235 family)